jgi:hypothetical protein
VSALSPVGGLVYMLDWHSQLGKPVNPLVRRCFQAQTWPFEGSFGGLSEGVGARGGPEKLIKMATANVPDASGMSRSRCC